VQAYLSEGFKSGVRLLVSVIVCTYGRAAALGDLLTCLARQTLRNLEVLVVDGNGDDSPARQTVEGFIERVAPRMDLRIIQSRPGLTAQRNLGLNQFRGDLICFFDDDVTIKPDFLEKAAALFERSDMQNVGGITGYDTLNYPMPVSLRWRLRWLFGAIPSLVPGDIDHLGRAVPVSFLKPFSGFKEVGWLSGFCMIYRRAAVSNVRFDELLPTYGGEDRDFSIQVGKSWRLRMCGDLWIEHHYAPQGRVAAAQRMFQTGFGVGRRFAKQARNFFDYCVMARSLVVDFFVDVLAFLHRPSRDNFQVTVARMSGFVAGVRSCSESRR